MFRDDEVYQIYEHIAAMCRDPDLQEACRMITEFCKKEMNKLEAHCRLNSGEEE